MESTNRTHIIAAMSAATKMLVDTLQMLLYSDEEDEYDENEDEYETFIQPPAKKKKFTCYVQRNITHMNVKTFQTHFRISRAAFEYLLPLINENIKKVSVLGRNRMETEKLFLATLLILGTSESYSSIGKRFDMSKASLSTAFFRIVNALNKLAIDQIRWPTEAEMPEIVQQFYNIAEVDNCIGVIDGTFIRIKTPKEDGENYLSTAGNHAVILQGTCDATYKFIDCFVGYPGSAGDTTVFSNSDLFANACEDPDTFFPDNDLFLIGDNAYPNLEWCVTPYEGAEEEDLTKAQQLFNTKLCETWEVIRKAFALLFGRFKRLRFLDMNKSDSIPATIMACCVLHNVCLNTDSDESDLLTDELIAEGYAYVQSNENYEVLEEFITEEAHELGLQKRDNICEKLFSQQ